ncbi:tripartite tricarboxylate transporter substrate binding protein [Pigmentiphaga soli]|uniref:Tripartite tricarboxylate transporter substrate binding protein n=1 Tax=Pigmentiphaga soli TaxID=1007095 RepID=A0ABP8GE57_9BURK
MVVSYVAGGSTDMAARTLAKQLGENMGQPVIVENRGGASGKIGAEAVAKAPADGYTLLFGEAGAMSINVWLMDRTGSYPTKDFVAVSQVIDTPVVLVAHPSLGVHNLKELVAKGRQTPLAYGSSGSGTVGHLAMEVLKQSLDLNLTHIPYRGGSQATADLLGGQIPLLAINVPTVAQYVRNGKAIGLAAFSSRRTTTLPDLPTVTEQGYPELALSVWQGVFAPAGTPPGIVARLNAEIHKAVQAPEVREALLAAGNEIVVNSPAEFSGMVSKDIERWGKVTRAAGLQP